MSSAADGVVAAEHAASAIKESGVRPDLLLAFVSGAHVPSAAAISTVLRRQLDPGCLLGVSASGVISGGIEVEHGPAIALLGLRLPGTNLRVFGSDDLAAIPGHDAPTEKLARVMGAGPDLRTTILLADPFSVPIQALLPEFDLALRHAQATAPVIGGLASGAHVPGGNALFLNDRTLHRGFVAVSIAGRVSVDTVVSQGARPIGPNLIITKARKNLIMQIGQRPAIAVIEEVVNAMPGRERQLLAGGLMIGRVIDESKRRFGRGDYLVRRITGMDAASGSIAVDGLFRAGQTICLHARHPETASSDLSLLLDAQALHEAPAAALLISCNARGSRLFDRPHHDASAVVRAFSPTMPGEQLAAGGKPIRAGGSRIPMSGFFASGEIGPIAGRTFVHGYTACLALFRRATSEHP
ncbi:MAG: FIST C-terminal domain-containing protein [Phycisphaeraceae bacterium]|nr:FIST C-terminal domain-containing protein [Phycisphaeraceae bacterium]MCW5753817.1 FIST C-terminal domain-containing protein [Phycisphaeraceae bacterium]